MIDGLPSDSHYVEAMADDEELAASILANPRDETPQVRMSEWSSERGALANIDDRLQVLTQAVAALGGSPGGRFVPSLRPVTAIDRLRRRDRILAHRNLMARLGID